MWFFLNKFFKKYSKLITSQLITSSIVKLWGDSTYPERGVSVSQSWIIKKIDIYLECSFLCTCQTLQFKVCRFYYLWVIRLVIICEWIHRRLPLNWPELIGDRVWPSTGLTVINNDRPWGTLGSQEFRFQTGYRKS